MNSTMNINNGTSGNAFSQWGMQAIQNAYQRTSNALSKAVKKNKAKLKYGTFVYLVNGTTKPLTKPKKKNRKHIQIIKHISDEITGLFDGDPTDITIRKAIKIIEKQLNS